MSTISVDTTFVGTQRNELRNLVRNHYDFAKWRAVNDPANKMEKSKIIQGINDLGLVDEALKILGKPQAATVETSEPDDSETESMTLADVAVETAREDSPIDSDIESVLGPVRPFLAGALVASMETALRPIVVAAHRAPTIVTQAAPVVLAKGEPPHATRVGVSTMQKVFSVGGAKGKKAVALWNDPLAPRPDPNYVMDGAAMYLCASAFENGESVWFFGPAGAGKTTRAQEYAALTGRGFVRIGFSHSTEMIDLLGQTELRGTESGASSETYWRDGAFVQAIRRAGTVILLDELTGSPPGTSMAFQTILDNRRVTLPTGAVVDFADGVVIAIADNTAGYGDESGIYAGTQAANGALVDRAARMIPVNYLAPLLEAEALHRHTRAPLPACMRVADFAEKVRTVQAQNKSDSRPFSIRRLIAFVNATYRDLMSADEAWTLVAYSRLPDLDREELRQAVKAHFEDKLYARELKGESIVANDPVQAPLDLSPDEAARQQAARDAFNQA